MGVSTIQLGCLPVRNCVDDDNNVDYMKILVSNRCVK